MFGLEKVFGNSDDDMFGEDKQLRKEIERSAKEAEKQRKQEAKEAEKREIARRKAEEELRLTRLKQEFDNDKAAIIQELQNNLKNGELGYARDLANRYAEVGYYDEGFRKLCDIVNERMNIVRKIQPLTAEYGALPDNAFKRKIEICERILKLDPNNIEYQDELEMCNAGICRSTFIVSKDLRIGRKIMYPELKGNNVTENPNRALPLCEVEIMLHTHGIRIASSSVAIRIHYSQIISLKTEDITESDFFGGLGGILKGAASGAISSFLNGDSMVLGAILGGVGAGLDGDSKGNTNPQICLFDIFFWSVKTGRPEHCYIQIPGSEDVAKVFIQKYKETIEETKRTKRSPLPEQFNAIVIACVSLGFLFFILPCTAVVVSDSSSNRVQPSAKPAAIVSQPAKPEPAPEVPNKPEPVAIKDWFKESDVQCTTKASGTTLIVSGTKASNASVVISGLGVAKCDKVSVSFDGKGAKKVSCSVKDSTVKLASDKGFVKSMRAASSMKVSVPVGKAGSEDLVYSLKGFSAACEWTGEPKTPKPKPKTAEPETSADVL